MQREREVKSAVETKDGQNDRRSGWACPSEPLREVD
jgi:hypothetical protein